MAWVDPATWQGQRWENYTASKHQGAQTARLTPYTQHGYNAQTQEDGRLVADPAGWIVCRITETEGTYRYYGYNDGETPNCNIGPPHSTRERGPEG